MQQNCAYFNEISFIVTEKIDFEIFEKMKKPENFCRISVIMFKPYNLSFKTQIFHFQHLHFIFNFQFHMHIQY
jgi:hypothetical protein